VVALFLFGVNPSLIFFSPLLVKALWGFVWNGGGTKIDVFVVNIYSKYDLAAKQRLWANLVLLKNTFGDGKWCMVGDFNAVTHVDERRGVNLVTSSTFVSEINFFNSFMRDVGL